MKMQHRETIELDNSATINRKHKGECMKTTSILSTLTAVLFAAAINLSPATSNAADSTGKAGSGSTWDLPANYMVLKGGMYSPSMKFDLDRFNNGNRTELDSKTGFAGEVAFGHYFLPMLAVELGGGYFESKGSPAAGLGQAKLKVVPLIATGKVFLPLGIFEPFGLAGIGAYITDLDVDGSPNNLHGSTEVTYGFHAGAGFNINFTKNFFAGVEGKYLWAEPSFGGQHVKLDGFVTTANIGFRF
jgi:outer membrane protein W